MRIARVVHTYSCAYRNGNWVSETPLLTLIIRIIRFKFVFRITRIFCKISRTSISRCIAIKCEYERTLSYDQPCMAFIRHVWEATSFWGIELSRIIVVTVISVVEFIQEGETRCTRSPIRKRRNARVYLRVKYVHGFYALLAFVSGRCSNVKRATGARCFRGIIRLKKTLTRLWNDPRPSVQLALARVRVSLSAFTSSLWWTFCVREDEQTFPSYGQIELFIFNNVVVLNTTATF